MVTEKGMQLISEMSGRPGQRPGRDKPTDQTAQRSQTAHRSQTPITDCPQATAVPGAVLLCRQDRNCPWQPPPIPPGSQAHGGGGVWKTEALSAGSEPKAETWPNAG